MFRFLQTKDNPVLATYEFLKMIGAKVTKKTIEENLKNHPDYPSLLAIRDTITDLQIESIVIRIPTEQIEEVQTPFLVFLTTNGGIFATVREVKNNIVEWLHPSFGMKRESVENFRKRWNGIVVAAEINKKSGEKNYLSNRKKEVIEDLRVPLILIGCFFLITNLFYFALSSNWQYNVLLVTKFIGFVATSLLVWQSVDKDNPFIHRICQLGEKVNCSSILDSNAAQINPWLSWSDVGFLYFLGGFIFLLIYPSSFYLLWLTGSVALVYSFWSVYYQGFIAKQWCILCLMVQGILWVEFLSLAPNLFSDFDVLKQSISYIIDHLPIYKLLVAFSIPGVVLLILKPVLDKVKRVDHLDKNLRKFRNNPDLFLSLLHNQPEMPFLPVGMELVNIGNPDAQYTLTMVTNLYCQPCNKAHKKVKDLLDNDVDVNCQIIFAASNDEGDKRGIAARAILSLPTDQQAKGLHEWYNQEERNIDKFRQEFNISETKKAWNIINQHKAWYETAQVHGTPTFYLDGYRMPELYQIDDLKEILKYMPLLKA